MMIMGLFLRAVTPTATILPGDASRLTATRKALSGLLAGGTIASLLAWPLASHALGLGRLVGEAVIGEALQLEVPLTGTPDRPLDSECVTVLRSPDSIDVDYFPRDLAGRIDRQAGVSRVLLTTRSAVRQPLVEFRVSISCGYNLSHDYVLMAAPRTEPVPAVVQAPGLAASAAIPRVAATSEPAFVAAPATTMGASLPDGLPGKNFVVGEDATLEDIARRHFPGPLRQQRFMRWIVEANPQYFAGAKNLRHQKLKSGTQLLIPDGVPPRRPGDHQGGITPLGEREADVTADAVAQPARKPRPGQPTERSGPTKTASDGSKDRLVVGANASTKNIKETIAIVDQLTGMMEKQLNAQTAYNEKIQQLEITVGTLDKQLKGLEAETKQRETQWQAEREAEKQARDQAAEREWWQLLIAVVAGGVLGGAILLALRALTGRRHDPLDDIENLPDEPQAPTKSAVADQEPLTEFGWDDEPASASRAPAGASPKSVARPAAHSPAPPTVGARTPPAPAAQQIDFEMPANMLTMEPVNQGPSDPATAAIELANIMTSMGLAESAAQTLVEHIRENPRESLPQWLKLLEIHRLNGNRSEFERSASEMREHFNVQPEHWTAGGAQGRLSIESYPHIRTQVVKSWRKPACLTLLRALLLDNREGTRIGFPLAVAEDILLLIAILNSSQ